jgi:hypothetical protein
MRGGYAEGYRRRSPALRRGLLYAEGGRRRSMAYVERRYADGSRRGLAWPGSTPLAPTFGRRHLQPFM